MYIKRSDFRRFETLKCPEIVLKFTKNFVLKCHYFLLGPLLILQLHACLNALILFSFKLPTRRIRRADESNA